MAFSKDLFSLLLPFLLVVMLVNKVESQNTSFTINNFTPNNPLLTYERDAFAPPDSPILRLASLSRPRSVGRVLYNTPVDLWATGTQASFSTSIVLQMTPIGGHKFSNGVTFFMVPVNSTTPSGGFDNNLGIYDAVPHGTPIFAFEIDGGRGDLNPDYPHVGININSGRSQNLSRAEDLVGGVVIAIVAYDARAKTINAFALYGPETVTVSYEFNLAAILPQRVQVGLSASTGVPAVTYLDVLWWQFGSKMEPDVIGAHQGQSQEINIGWAESLI